MKLTFKYKKINKKKFFFSCLDGVWRYECIDGYCNKTPLKPEDEETALSLAVCHLYCSGSGGLWPKPTGEIDIGTNLTKVNVNSVDLLGLNSEKPSSILAKAAFNRYKQRLTKSVPYARATSGGTTLEVSYVIVNTDISDLTLETDESYTLLISLTSDGRLNATISADNYFGVHHAVETLNQLTVYDDLRDEVKIPNNVKITDKPKYPYRGILLDTSRNYISVDAIKKTLDAMGASKLNRFHWHITDSQSFPFTAESLPNLQKYGAYSAKKIYTPENVADIINYGLERGVRVIPEFDAPAHVGEGWEQTTDFITCFNWKPWQDYCVEPPCGQFDPTKSGLYDALESKYTINLKFVFEHLFYLFKDIFCVFFRFLKHLYLFCFKFNSTIHFYLIWAVYRDYVLYETLLIESHSLCAVFVTFKSIFETYPKVYYLIVFFL